MTNKKSVGKVIDIIAGRDGCASANYVISYEGEEEHYEFTYIELVDDYNKGSLKIL